MRRATAVLVLAAMLAIGGPAAVAAAHQPRLQFRKVRVPPGMAVYEWHNAGDLSTAQVPFKRGQWGKMHRKGIRGSTQAPATAEEAEPERITASV